MRQGPTRGNAIQNGCTALMWVAADKHLDMTRLLCEAGADKDKATETGAAA